MLPMEMDRIIFRRVCLVIYRVIDHRIDTGVLLCILCSHSEIFSSVHGPPTRRALRQHRRGGSGEIRLRTQPVLDGHLGAAPPVPGLPPAGAVRS